jgi:hypothetical protein
MKKEGIKMRYYLKDYVSGEGHREITFQELKELVAKECDAITLNAIKEEENGEIMFVYEYYID